MMDDALLLSTSREGLLSKIKIGYEFCRSHGLIINNSKTKVMVVNGSSQDKEPMACEDNVINYYDHCIYLGSPVTDEVNVKMCHTLKFMSFVLRNDDVVFTVKKKILDAAVPSTLLYGCESCITGGTKPIENQYKSEGPLTMMCACWS